MEIDEITQHVIAEIEKKYHLVPKKADLLDPRLFIDTVINVTCDFYQITREALMAKSRCRIPTMAFALPQVRAIIFHICANKVPSMTMGLIGEYCGNRDQSTVLIMAQKASEWLGVDKHYRKDYEEIKNTVYQTLKL